MLLNQHNESLRQFRVFSLSDKFVCPKRLPPLSLEDIECRCLKPVSPSYDDQDNEEDDMEMFVRVLIRANSETLRSLSLGREAEVLLSNYTASVHRDKDDDEVLGALCLEDTLLRLSSLKIVGLNVSPAQSDYFSKSIELSLLRNLTIESCPGSATLIRQLGAAVITDGLAEPGGLALKEFTFRHEAPDSLLMGALEAFLSRISPLTHLSVLLDNTDTMPRVSRFIARHGATLKSLVWSGRHSRPGYQDCSLSLGNIRDPTSELTAILENCTKLIELSVAWDWCDLNMGDDPTSSLARRGAGFLKQMGRRTLHIRNSPAWMNHYGLERLTRALVTKLLDYCLDFESDGVDTHFDPRLELVIVGPLSYSQKWELQHSNTYDIETGKIHELWHVGNRPTFFKVGYTKVFGVHTYAVMQEELTTISSIQDRFEARVLDSVWMIE